MLNEPTTQWVPGTVSQSEHVGTWDWPLLPCSTQTHSMSPMYVFRLQYLNTRVTLPFRRAKDVRTASSCHLNHAHKIYYTRYKIKCKLLYTAQNISFLYWLRGAFYLMIFSIAQFMYIEHQWSVNKCKYRAVAKWYWKGKPEVLREKPTGRGCGAVCIGTWRPTFQSSMLPPSSGKSTLLGL